MKQEDPKNPADTTPNMPVSEARSAAARANGAKSRGPRTEKGKDRSSRNAIKHSLLAHKLTVSDAETAILENLELAYTQRFNPRDALESHAIEELAYYKCQMRQTWMMQASSLHIQMERDFQELQGEWDSIPALERQAMAITSSLKEGPALLLLERYTRMYANLADRALNQIVKLRKERLLPDAPAGSTNEPEADLPNEPESEASPSAPTPATSPVNNDSTTPIRAVHQKTKYSDPVSPEPHTSSPHPSEAGQCEDVHAHMKEGGDAPLPGKVIGEPRVQPSVLPGSRNRSAHADLRNRVSIAGGLGPLPRIRGRT